MVQVAVYKGSAYLLSMTDKVKLSSAGSITASEKGVNKILDELLSKDGEDLDDDRALSLLQERLQIKPIDLGNLSIPEFQGFGRTDFKALGERLPKARKSVPNMSDLIKRSNRETPKKCKEAEENPRNPIASPTPPRSPFASLSLLKMRTLQSNQLRDPFSPLNIDMLEHRDPFSLENIDNQSDQVDMLKELSMSDRSRSEMEAETSKSSGSEMDIHTMESRGSESLLHDSVDRSLEGQVSNTNTRPDGCKMDLQDNLSSGEIHREIMDCHIGVGTASSDLRNGPVKMAEDVSSLLDIRLAQCCEVAGIIIILVSAAIADWRYTKSCTIA